MKRLSAVILALLMLISCLTACGSDSSGEKASASSSGSASDAGTSSDDTGNSGKMTIMMYVVGSNLESERGFASMDFLEIVESDFDVDKVDFVIYTGGANTWRSGISSQYNSTYHVELNNGAKDLKLVDQSSEYKDMAAPETLSDFINYSYENYPADRYSLILWDHGGGPTLGYGEDEISNNSMPLNDIKKALDATPFKDDNKLDFLGFDACLMGSVEVGSCLKDYAHYLIASEESEPGLGWDYNFMSDVSADTDTEDIGKSIIDNYYSKDQYVKLLGKDASGALADNKFTLSCVNLDKVDDLNTAVNDLFSRMIDILHSENARQLLAVRTSVFTYGFDKDIPYAASDLVDIGALADLYADQYPEVSAAIKDALDEYVVYSKSDIQPSYGVTIYYPYEGIANFLGFGCNTYTDYSVCPDYVEYIREYTSALYQNCRSSASTGRAMKANVAPMTDVNVSGGKITVTLTEDQKKNAARSYVNVLRKSLTDEGRTSYVPVTLNQQIAQDGDGNLTMDADISIPVVNTGSSEIVWPMQVKQEVNGTTYYQSINSYVAASAYDQANTVMKPVVISSELKDGETELKLTGINYSSGESLFSGKNTVDTTDWNSICDYEIAKYEQRDDKAMLPYEDWEDQGSISQTMMDYRNDFSIVMTPLSRLENTDYYYQIVMEDADGKFYATDPIKCSVGVKVESASEKTGSGTLTYSVFDDHAEVKKYSGKDKKLTIPAEYKGVPVTKVCGNFFDIDNDSAVGELVIESADTILASGCLYHASVDKVTLPDGYKKIGPKAFCNSYVKQVTLPDSVEEIGDLAFAYCEKLVELNIPASVTSLGAGVFAGTLADKKITVDSGNTAFKLEDDSLLSADGKILYARLNGKDTYTVPDGVEIIARYACVGDKYHGDKNINDNLTTVTLPDSLQIIQSDAFRNCSLKELAIPDSVTYIANGAFENYSNSGVAIAELKIGSGLEYLGIDAFYGITVEKAEVSEDNKYFSSADGKLMNKAGDKEIAVGITD